MAISPSTMARLRARTPAMLTETGPVSVPNSAACLARWATLALQISFLLGRQLVLGQARSDQPALHLGDGLTGAGQVPGKECSSFSAADDQCVEVILVRRDSSLPGVAPSMRRAG
jgi:hypothetical protein